MPPYKGYLGRKANKLDEKTLAGTPLPDKTKCIVCHRTKAINSFSKNQQNSLKTLLITHKVKNLEQAKAENIRCSECSNTRRNELQCALCNKWKGLESFSKRQRTCGDEACCSTCINVKENSAPTPTDREMNEALDSEADSDNDDSEIGEGSFLTNEYADSMLSGATISTFGKLTIKDNASQASASTFHTALDASAGAATTTGYLPPHVRKAGQSITMALSTAGASPAASEASTPSRATFTVAPRQQMTRAGSNFAKLKAAPSNKIIQLDDGGGRQASDTESSDDEDEGPLM